MAAAPTDRRLVVVILRGALDGLAAVAPYGDPAFAELRGQLAPKSPGQEGGLLDLGGFYGLHPALAGLHADVCGGPVPAGARGGRASPHPQPFRGAGHHGVRRRPAPDQRLAEPRGAGHGADAGRAPRRSRSASPCRCCCAARRRSAPTRRTASSSRSPTSTPGCWRCTRSDPVTGPGDPRRPARARLHRRPARGASRQARTAIAFATLAAAAGRLLAAAGRAAHRGHGDRRLGHACRAGAAAGVPAETARRRARRAARRAWARPGARRRCWS